MFIFKRFLLLTGVTLDWYEMAYGSGHNAVTQESKFASPTSSHLKLVSPGTLYRKHDQAQRERENIGSASKGRGVARVTSAALDMPPKKTYQTGTEKGVKNAKTRKKFVAPQGKLQFWAKKCTVAKYMNIASCFAHAITQNINPALDLLL